VAPPEAVGSFETGGPPWPTRRGCARRWTCPGLRRRRDPPRHLAGASADRPKIHRGRRGQSLRIHDGRIAETWTLDDNLERLAQLGLLPPLPRMITDQLMPNSFHAPSGGLAP